MTRFAQRAGLLMAFALAGLAGPPLFAQDAQDEAHRWSLVMAWPKNLPGLATSVDRMAERVRGMSGGRLRIHVYAAGELVPAYQVFDAVASGTAQAGHAAAYYWQGKIPGSVFYTAVPFGATAPQLSAWLYHGGGLEAWRELYAGHGVVPFPGGNSGTQMMGWFRKPIDSLSDLRGLKIRAPGLGGEVLAGAGASPVSLPGGELYTALQNGVIDAVEWVGPYNDRSLGFDRIAPYYYYPGWHEPGSELELLINRTAWDALSPELQMIVSTAAEAMHLDMLSEYAAQNGIALAGLLQVREGRRPVELRGLPRPVLDELRSVARRITRDAAEKDADYARISASFWDYLRRAHAYGEVGEEAQIALRSLQRKVHGE
ncbi:MAG: TRAP transporter substrate-binding protein [Gammaproteobacteria bacterium AqS3]|nr:TRAP transporter substrate-binding protein [Gammaproteobacteria bacterium AqS3]